jgi:ribosomal protein S18 acetylase RimI-like enzyme
LYEEHPGKHIGKALGLAAIEFLKNIGAKRLWLESNRVMAPAINLYFKLGFKEIPLGFTPFALADIRDGITILISFIFNIHSE